ncbi:MAG: hypothetical protein ACAH80_01090 [Alphaproteobacteria bacterium]
MRLATAVIIACTLALAVLVAVKYNAFVSGSPDARAIIAVTDLNPFIQNDDEIIGEWSRKNEHLALFADRTFTYGIDGKVNKGSWIRRDCDLLLYIGTYSTAMRFAKKDRRQFLLMPAIDFSEAEGDEHIATAIISAFQKRER